MKVPVLLELLGAEDADLQDEAAGCLASIRSFYLAAAEGSGGEARAGRHAREVGWC